MGELTNVSQEADIAEDGSVLMYRDNEWKPAAECFIPTGTAEDGSIITTFSDLMNYISTHGEGGGGTGVQRNIRITNNLESKNISASKGEPCLLDFTFISQEDIALMNHMKTQENVVCARFRSRITLTLNML